jgi:hypothetical protein
VTVVVIAPWSSIEGVVVIGSPRTPGAGVVIEPGAGPSPIDDSGVPASSDDCPHSPDDDTSHLPPDVEV